MADPGHALPDYATRNKIFCFGIINTCILRAVQNDPFIDEMAMQKPNGLPRDGTPAISANEGINTMYFRRKGDPPDFITLQDEDCR